MARKRFNKSDAKEKIYFPFENTISPTGALIEKIIYSSPANEWRKPVEANQVATSQHICTFVLIASTNHKKKNKTFGHRQLPKRYLEQIATNTTNATI
jgi:hypothetical protein